MVHAAGFRQDVEGAAGLKLRDGLPTVGIGIEWTVVSSTSQRDGAAAHIQLRSGIITAHPADGAANTHLIPGPCAALLLLTGIDHRHVGVIDAKAVGVGGGFCAQVGSDGIYQIPAEVWKKDTRWTASFSSATCVVGKSAMPAM